MTAAEWGASDADQRCCKPAGVRESGRPAYLLSNAGTVIILCFADDGREQTIAQRLCRSAAADDEHVNAIYRHFGVASRGELLAYAPGGDPLARKGASPPGVLN